MELTFETTHATQFHAEIPNDLTQIRPTAQRAIQFLKEFPFPDDFIHSWDLILTESLANAMIHAPHDRDQLPIHLSLTLNSHTTEARITDHTYGFSLPPILHLPPDDYPNGRGLYLMRTHTDWMDYQRGTYSNTLLLRKNHPANFPKTPSPATDSVTSSEAIIQAMANDLSVCYEALSAIFRVGSELSKTHNNKIFVQKLLSDLLRITEADCFVLRLRSPDLNRIPLTLCAPTHTRPVAPISLNDTQSSFEAHAVAEGKDTWFDSSHRFPDQDALSHLVQDCHGFVHPIILDQVLIGILTIGKKSKRPPWTAAQVNVVHIFCEFLSIQMIHKRFLDSQIKTRLMSREVEIARNIQRSLLPQTLPTPPGASMIASCETTHQVGGDFYDVLSVHSGLLLIIADVMGKGIPAAMLAANARCLIRSHLSLCHHPGKFLQWLNAVMFTDLTQIEMFITLQMVWIDPSTRRVRSASAGHCPPLWMSPDDPEPIPIPNQKGFPLGIEPDATYQEEEWELKPGSRLLLYTDGLTESRNPQGDLFGEDTLKTLLQENTLQQSPLESFQNRLAGSLHAFNHGILHADDQTYLVFADTTYQPTHTLTPLACT